MWLRAMVERPSERQGSFVWGEIVAAWQAGKSCVNSRKKQPPSPSPPPSPSTLLLLLHSPISDESSPSVLTYTITVTLIDN